MKNKFWNKSEDRQHFSLRKLTVGVASVLLGTTFMIFGSQTSEVHAADNAVETVEVTKTSSQNINKSTDEVNTEAKTASTDKVTIKADQPEVKSASAEELAKTVNVEANKESSAVKTTTNADKNKKVDGVDISATESGKQAANKKAIANEAGNDSQTIKEEKTVASDAANSSAVKTASKQNSSISDEEKSAIAKAYHLDEPDLTDEQLAKLGLKHGEFYYNNGTKSNIIVGYENTDSTVTLYDGTVIDFGKINIRHNADGTVLDNNLAISDDDLFDLDIQKSNFKYIPVPNMTGKTIYVNKGSKLSTDDASRGVQNISGIPADSITDNQWDNTIPGRKVDTDVAGEQNGVVDITYSVGGVPTNVAVGVKVIVVDLKGKDITTHIGADVPTADTSVDGQPKGAKATWTDQPSTDQAGDSKGTVEVTYPDGNKGTADVTLHVLAPEPKKTVEVWQGDPIPAADTAITNSTDINSKLLGTTYTWGTVPGTETPGDFPATVITHWTDGKTTTSQTTIVVKKLHEHITTGEGTEKTVTRDIYTQLEGQQPEKIYTEPTTIHREGTKNLKTGEIKWDAWQVGEMPAYKAPLITNYTVTNPDAGKAVLVDGSVDKLADVVFKYKANHESITTGKDSEMTVTRNVYENVNDTVSTVTNQSILLHRVGDKNVVTGEIKWGAWQPATLSKVDAPAEKGYTVTNPDAAPEVIADGSVKKFDDVTFVYTANAQKQIVNYVDINDNSHVVGTDTINGKTDEKVAFTAKAPTNWVIVPGQQIPSSITFRAEEAAPINILVDHGHRFNQDGDQKVVTRIVNAINPETGKTEEVTTQEAKLTRSTDTDLVTGKVTYGQWNTASFEAVPAPTFKGYTVINPDDARAMTVTGATPNINVTFRYAANYFNQQVNYVNKANNKVVSTDNIGGQTNSTVVYDVNVPANYKLAEGEPSQITVKFGNTAPTDAKIIYVVEGTAPVYDGTHKTVTRAIYTQLEGQDKTWYQDQSVQLTRTGERNLVTGKVTYTDWQPVTMDKFTAPKYENYTVQNPDAAPAVTADGSVDKLASVTFVYKANHQTITDGNGTSMEVTRDIYTNVDGTKTKVQTQSETLHRTGDKNMATGKIVWNPWETKNMPAYQAPEIKDHTVINPDAGAAVKMDGSTNKLADVVFNYKDNHETITAGDGTEKTVTRDIYTSLDGKEPTYSTTQKVTLHRRGDKNLVTGEIKWGAWSTDTIGKVVAPKIDNYTVTNPDAGPAVKVDGSVDKLDRVVFNYKSNTQTITTGDGTQMQVSRDIYTNVDGKKTKVNTQSTILHRTGVKNLATGKITWNSWESKKLDVVPAPSIPGYVVTNPDAGASVIADGSRAKLDDVVFNYTLKYHVSVPAGEKVTTHVGANENVPSLNPANVNLNWTDKDGKAIDKPAGVTVSWTNVPSTTSITDETGTLKITYADGYTTTLDIPVTVQGATAGDIQKVHQNDEVPAAKTTVNTSTVDHFGITNVTWKTTPSTAVPGANIPGVATVHYSDGTTQDVDVNLDVLEVRRGEDNKGDKNIYREIVRTTEFPQFGNTVIVRTITTIGTRDQIIDYAYPEGDSRRVTYTKWVRTTHQSDVVKPA